jgi:hypothetical protein
MKITQVSADYVKAHLGDSNIYSILICDDGKGGRSHRVARMKPLKNLTMEEFVESVDNQDYGFITVDEEG